ERVAARFHLLLVRATVDNDGVRLDGALLYLTDVVNEEQPLPSNLEAVRRVEELGAERALRTRQQSLLVAVVVAVDPGEREFRLLERPEDERRTVVAGMEDHADTAGDHEAEQLGDSGNSIVRVGHETDAHQLLHSGSSIS